MHDKPLAVRLDQAWHIGLDQVPAERQEARRTVVDDEVRVFRQHTFDQLVDTADVELVLYQQFDRLRFESGKADERAIDRVGVQANERPIDLAQILGEQTGNERFANPALTSEYGMNLTHRLIDRRGDLRLLR